MAEPSPHLLLFPFPSQGTFSPMLNLARLLALAADFHITLLNTTNFHHRLLASSPADFPRLADLPRFRFRTISDGLPPDDPRPFMSFVDLEQSLKDNSVEQYRNILDRDRDDTDGWPPVGCVVADGILSLASEVPEEMGIPVVVFRTSGACAVWAYQCLSRLVDDGELPFGEDDDLDVMMRGVPSMESFLRRRDLPSMMRTASKDNDSNDIRYLNRVNANIARGKAFVLNTFESLESPVLDQLRTRFPFTYTVGPLHALIGELESSGSIATNVASLWEEDRSCIAWLDSQPTNSVVYVSFGTSTLASAQVVLEFWHGLVSSGHRFLWVIRSDLVADQRDEATELAPPLEVVEGTKERGCIVQWAPQVEVLSHPAVGCFLTHSGWNSTMESIAAGVPMICWPFFADQMVNSRFVSEVWKNGVDMKGQTGRGVVEEMVRAVMEGERAAEFRRSASEMAEKVRSSVCEGGSSYENLQRLVQHIRELSRAVEHK